VAAPESLGNEHFHRLPEHLFARKTEQLFRLSVDQNDATLLVRDDQRIRRGLHQIIERDLSLRHESLFPSQDDDRTADNVKSRGSSDEKLLETSE
jgi:hypothetical protein